MKKILAILISFLLSSCEVSVDSSPTITLPPEFGQEETQMFLSSMDIRQLERNIASKFPSAINNQVSFYFRPVFYQSLAGKGKKMMVKIDVNSKDGWSEEKNLGKYLEKILSAKIEGANNESLVESKDVLK